MHVHSKCASVPSYAVLNRKRAEDGFWYSSYPSLSVRRTRFAAFSILFFVHIILPFAFCSLTHSILRSESKFPICFFISFFYINLCPRMSVCVCVVVRYICNMHINVYVHSLVLYVMNEIRFVSKTQEKGYIAHSVQIRAKALFHSTASTEIVGLCPLVFFFAFISPLW